MGEVLRVENYLSTLCRIISGNQNQNGGSSAGGSGAGTYGTGCGSLADSMHIGQIS